MARAPRTISVRSPWKRANRIENEVRGTSPGVSATTFRNAWESVMTSLGGRFRRPRAALSSRSFTTRQNESESSRSRIVCTWGRIRRPFGASLSIGTTSTTSSPGPTRSPTIRRASKYSAGAAASSAPRSSSMPVPWRAAVQTVGSFSAARRATRPGSGTARSDLLNATMTGTRRASSSARSDSSKEPHEPASATSTPRSVRSRTLRVLAMRCSPRAPASSTPAVSMNSTGPSGSSSIGFSTGSVVVPGVADTIATSCRVIALRRLDLPTLRRPKSPMCRRKLRGALWVTSACQARATRAGRRPRGSSAHRTARPSQSRHRSPFP